MNPPPTGVITPIASRRRAAASEHGATSPAGAAGPRGRAAARPSARVDRLRALARDGEDGFTLVELLVVVLMLVALVGIAVPTFIGQQERAERAAVQSELRTAAIALESYRARNGEYSADALATPEYGFVRSLDVATFFTDAIAADRFCVRGWFESVEPGETHDPDADDADENAVWAVTDLGMFFIGDATGARTCPPRPASS